MTRGRAPNRNGVRPNTDDEIASLRAIVRAGAKNTPGVYRMVSDDGGVLYVGKSKRLRTRLLSYFRAEPYDKGARILRETRNIIWEEHPSELAALLGELRMIKRHRPRFNVAMKRDDGRYVFIKVTRGRAPKLYVVRGSSGDSGGLYYGPFAGVARVREAVRALNDALGLRDCSEDVAIHWSDQQELFTLGRRTPGCIRYEVKKCLGPCVAGCSSNEYDLRLRTACAFLEGRSDGPTNGLRQEMEAASARLEYERAASLRNKVTRLGALREQFGRLRFALESLSFIYPVTGHEGDDRIYLIRRGTVRAEVKAPSNDDEHRAIERLAADIYGAVEPAGAPVPNHEIDEILLLSSWFRRFPDELERVRRFSSSIDNRS